ncbi:MAG: DJ-1/PfpI family protein [Candidatus Micrarchaeia archaeon]
MKAVIIIPPKDFKDETLSAALDMLQKWGITPTIASYTSGECVGYHGAVYKPDINAARIKAEDYNMLILVDGTGIESYKLYDFRPLLDLVHEFSYQKRLIVAISNAAKILARSNIIANIKLSIPGDDETNRLVRLYKGIVSDNEIEFDNNIMTVAKSDDARQAFAVLIEKLGLK